MTICELRRRKGLTQAEVARELGVNQATVCLWERGKTFPRAAAAVKLAGLLGCSLDTLYASAMVSV